jgi:hypothetical protein
MRYIVGGVLTVKNTYDPTAINFRRSHDLVDGDHWIVKEFVFNEYGPGYEDYYTLIHMSGAHTIIVTDKELAEYFGPLE